MVTRFVQGEVIGYTFHPITSIPDPFNFGRRANGQLYINPRWFPRAVFFFLVWFVDVGMVTQHVSDITAVPRKWTCSGMVSANLQWMVSKLPINQACVLC